MFLFSKHKLRCLPSILFSSYWRHLPSVVKRPELEADHSHPTSAHVMNKCELTSTPLHVFKTCTRTTLPFFFPFSTISPNSHSLEARLPGLLDRGYINTKSEHCQHLSNVDLNSKIRQPVYWYFEQPAIANKWYKRSGGLLSQAISFSSSLVFFSSNKWHNRFGIFKTLIYPSFFSRQISFNFFNTRCTKKCIS